MDTHSGGSLAPVGSLSVRRVGAPPARPLIRSLDDALAYGTPQPRGRLQALLGGSRGRQETLERLIWQEANAEHFQRSLDDVGRFQRGALAAMGTLWGRVIRRDGSVLDLGLMSCRVVTNAGAGFLVDAMQGLVEPELLRYHGLGTGTAAEAVTDTALGAELTTQYSTASTRPTGSLGEKSGDARTYETSATITVSASVAATEHGIFSQAAVPGGVLLDRSVFAVVNLAAAESLQTTYQLNFPAGG